MTSQERLINYDVTDAALITVTSPGPNPTTQKPGNTKGGSTTVPLTSCLTGLESAV